MDNLLGTGGQLDAGLALVGVVANNGDVVTGGTAQSTTVTDLLLNVGNNGTLGHGTQGQDVANGQSGVLAGVDELAGVHALVGNEGLGVQLEAVGVTEDDLGEGSATAGIVDNLLHNTTDVAMSLGVVEGSELGGSLVQAGDGVEYGGATLTLVADNATHLDGLLVAAEICTKGLRKERLVFCNATRAIDRGLLWLEKMQQLISKFTSLACAAARIGLGGAGR